MLSRLFQRLFVAALADAHAAGQLAFFGEVEDLRHRDAFAARLAPFKRKDWFVHSKPRFSGPEAVRGESCEGTDRARRAFACAKW
jgi:hypothetical protein